MASNEEDNEMSLSAKECQARIDQFVEVTNTDEAQAQSVLQDHAWNLEEAINAFLASNHPDPGLALTTTPPSTLAMISWNIDGLDEKNLPKRAAYVASEIKKLKPDVVLLQEATEMIIEILDKQLGIDYHVIEQQGGAAVARADYFTCILLRHTTIYLDDARTKMFENTKMGRGSQRVLAHIGKVQLCFINVHLESTKDFRKERLEQLEQCLEEIKNTKEDVTVILAGDLNIRDSEVASLRNDHGLPSDVKDVWESLGKRKELQYTWDCLRNTNLQVSQLEISFLKS